MAKSKASPANSVGLMPDAEWQAEEDLRTCLRYKEIMKDPKRKAAMKKIATKKLAELQSINEK
ncbi:MAG: hypothetical protein ACRC2H_00965 [Silanimonas sp.]